jgi:hypothetical protein
LPVAIILGLAAIVFIGAFVIGIFSRK